MNLNTINPYIRVAMRSILREGVVIGQRIIYDYELIYLAEGTFTLIYAGTEYQCKKGQFIFLRPGVPHTLIVNQGNISQPHIHFDLSYKADSQMVPVSFKDIDAFSEDEIKWIRKDEFQEYPLTPFVHFNNEEAFLELFFKVVSVPRGEHSLAQKAAMLELIGTLIADNFPGMTIQDETEQNISQNIKDYIDCGLGLKMNLADFEKQFMYDRFYLETCFKKRFGISLISYRNKIRMNTARELLKTSSVSYTAETVGYQSIYSFSRAYKNFFGVSPTKDSEIMNPSTITHTTSILTNTKK